jgi:hypothetical protein
MMDVYRNEPDLRVLHLARRALHELRRNQQLTDPSLSIDTMPTTTTTTRATKATHGTYDTMHSMTNGGDKLRTLMDTGIHQPMMPVQQTTFQSVIPDASTITLAPLPIYRPMTNKMDPLDSIEPRQSPSPNQSTSDILATFSSGENKLPNANDTIANGNSQGVTVKRTSRNSPANKDGNSKRQEERPASNDANPSIWRPPHPNRP